jgi:predicted Holliday junction resolvase-like endonuclease
METTMFTLGVLAMIMVMLITVVVVGIVKVFKMSKQIKELYSHIHETERHLSERIYETTQALDSKFRDVYTDINMVESTLRNGVDYATKSVNDQITDAVTQSNSYTDKRVDKLIDTYFMVKEAEQNNKNLIKG